MSRLNITMRLSNWLLLILSIVSLNVFSKNNFHANTLSKNLSAEIYQKPELINQQWDFYKTDQEMLKPETIQNWESVDLPHTAHPEAKPVINQWQGFSWYRKKLPSKLFYQSAKIFVDFEGAMNRADVFLNGQLLKTHLGGYLPFSVDITDALNESDNNWLYVRLDNRDNPITGPKPLAQLDFNTYGGIYRNVWLRRENSIYITDSVDAARVASGGVFVSYPLVSDALAKINVQTHLQSVKRKASVTVYQMLYEDSQLIKSTSASIQINLGKEFQLVQSLEVTNPILWSPENPHLYRLVTQLKYKDKILDQQETNVGIREFKIQNGELFINGQKKILHGVNRHQEYPYIGYALSDVDQYRDAEKIKLAGFDYVRLSHYPQSNAFMDAADKLGLVLLDSILGWQYAPDDAAFNRQVVQTCRDLIRRDRNHASVFAWECSLNESDMKQPLIDSFIKTVHEEFPGENVYSAGWKDQGYDIFLQARQHRIEHYQTPKKAYLVSEYGDWEYYAMNAGFNQDQWSNLLQADRSSRQLLSDGELRLQQQAKNIAEAYNDNFNTPQIADGYWVMFDYNRGYSPDLESSGLMSVDRLPKFSYYFFQSQRDAEEIIKGKAWGYQLFVASNWDKNSSLRVPFFSNSDQLKIFLNDRYVGDAVADKNLNHLKHPVRYFTFKQFEPGVLRAEAYVNGQRVSSAQVKTPGTPTQLNIRLEKTKFAPQANQKDAIFVYVDWLDQQGILVPLSHQKLSVNVTGDAQLVSPASLESEAGTAAAVLVLGKDLSTVTLDVKAEFLPIKSVKLVDLIKAMN